MNQAVYDALPVAAAIFLVRFAAAEAVYQRAQRTKRGLRFPAGLGLRLLFRLGGPLALYAAYKILSTAIASFDRGVAALVAAMGIGCLLGEPGPITVTATGIMQTTLFGLRRKQIEWDGAAASYVPGLRRVIVVGGDGTAITHSQYHVGQAEFIGQLKERGIYVQGSDPRPS